MATATTINLDTAFFEDYFQNADEVIFTEGQDTWVRHEGELQRAAMPVENLRELLLSVSDDAHWDELEKDGETFFSVSTNLGFYHVTYFTESNCVLGLFIKSTPDSEMPFEFQEAIRNRTIQ